MTQDELLTEQHIKISDFQAIISSYQHQNSELAHSLTEAEKIIEEMNKQIEVTEERKRNQLRGHYELQDKVEERENKCVELEKENLYYQ